MTIRLACASTFTALGLACSSAALARVAAYAPVPVIYAPPVADPLPAALPASLPLAADVAASYAAAPAFVITYAQALIAVPNQSAALACREFAGGEAAACAQP